MLQSSSYSLILILSTVSSVAAETVTQVNNAENSGVTDSGEAENTQVIPINQVL